MLITRISYSYSTSEWVITCLSPSKPVVRLYYVDHFSQIVFVYINVVLYIPLQLLVTIKQSENVLVTSSGNQLFYLMLTGSQHYRYPIIVMPLALEHGGLRSEN